MHILYFSQYYPPEVGATQTRAYEMSRYLASRGHKVTVVTEVPNHPSGVVPPAYRGRLFERCNEEGVDVLRLWVWAAPEKSFKSRMRFYISYMGMAAITGSILAGLYDLVYATSPPLFVGAAGLAAATMRRVPFVFEVRDLWPESAVALGELRNRRAVQAAEWLEKLLYKRAWRVIAVTHGIRTRLVKRGVLPSKIELIPNGANTELFQFSKAGRIAMREKLRVSDKFVAMYAGIHGIAQGLETLLDTAELLRDRSDITFVFIGEGPRKQDLLKMAEGMALENVLMLPEVPSVDMPAYLSAADCAIVPLKNDPLFRGALPSKLFEAWACSRPVVLTVRGEAESVLNEAGGGLACAPEDPRALAAALCELAANPEGARAMGARGRHYVSEHFSRYEQAQALEKVLSNVLLQIP